MAPTLLVPGSLTAKNNVVPPDIRPIDYIVSWVKSRMFEFMSSKIGKENRILLVRAKTGSGKSTTMPVELFRIISNKNMNPEHTRYKQYLICTQPKVLTCRENARELSKSDWAPDMKLGFTVGYKTGPEKENIKSGGILFMTIQILINMLINLGDKKFMERYKFIIIDEVHERSSQTDFAIAELRNFYNRNCEDKNLPFLILTSATFNPKRLLNYFQIPEDNIMEVEGKSFPKYQHWALKDVDNFIKTTVETCIELHKENISDTHAECDILAFVTSENEAKTISQLLNKSVTKEFADKYGSFFSFPIYGSNINKNGIESVWLSMEDYNLLPKQFGQTPKRRIFIATSVAETGLTLNRLKYVIENGWSKTKENYPPLNASGITTKPAPLSRATQREGRVGRLFPGFVFHNYTKNTMANMVKQQLPDIITNGIHETMLNNVWGCQKQNLLTGKPAVFNIDDLFMYDFPGVENFIMSNRIASQLGFISDRAMLPTDAGDEDKSALEHMESSPSNICGMGLTKLGHISRAISGTRNIEEVKVILTGLTRQVCILDIVTTITDFGMMMPKKDRKLIVDVYSPIFPDQEPNVVYYLSKIVFGDDFISKILIFNKIQCLMDKDIYEFNDWCNKMEIDQFEISQVIERRDAIITGLIDVGINPFKNFKKSLRYSNTKDMLFIAQEIKHCLYSGFKSNLLRLNKEGTHYLTSQGINVSIPSSFKHSDISKIIECGVLTEEHIPRWIITNEFSLKQVTYKKIKLLKWELTTNSVSVLDGFVNVIPDFGYIS